MVHDNTVKPGQASLKSGKSSHQSFVRFVNKSTRSVDVLWINYQGVRESYKILAPEEGLNVDTFIGHPWVFRDSVTHQPLVVNSLEVFYPQTPKLRRVPQRPVWQPVRTLVHINIPVYSLRELCMHYIRHCLLSKDEVFCLEIPHCLQEELSQKWKLCGAALKPF